MYDASIIGRTTGPLRLVADERARSDCFPKFDDPGAWARKIRAPIPRDTVSERTNQMNTGTVKFYNGQKGFGFIQPDNGERDVFVHATALERAGINGLQEGQKVRFDTQSDPRSGKVAVGTIEIA
jgi:CspA family cold shock protein